MGSHPAFYECDLIMGKRELKRKRRKRRRKISYFNIISWLIIMANMIATGIFIVKPLLENSVMIAELSSNCDVYKVCFYGEQEKCKVSAEEYDGWSFEERMHFVRKVMEDAGMELGLTGEICVIIKDLHQERINGYYSSFSDAIYIERERIENGTLEETIKTALHELNHLYYQRVFECLDKLDNYDKKLKYFDLANELCDNNKHYIGVDSWEDYGFQGYYDQPLEVEARQYAEKEAGKYIKK